MIKKELGLRIPGPTPIPPSVLQAMQQPMVSHRGTEFTDIVASLQGDLRYLFQTENDCLILAGSGTAAMEAAVANLVAPGRPVLAVVAGKFGERWSQLARTYQADVKELIVPWGQGVDLNQLAAAIAHHQPEVLLLHTMNHRRALARYCWCCRMPASWVFNCGRCHHSLGGAEFHRRLGRRCRHYRFAKVLNAAARVIFFGGFTTSLGEDGK